MNEEQASSALLIEDTITHTPQSQSAVSRKAGRRSPNLQGVPKEKSQKIADMNDSHDIKAPLTSSADISVNGKDQHETVQFSARLTARIRMAELQKASCECGKCELPQNWLPAHLRVHLRAMTNAKIQAKLQKEQEILRASDPDLQGVHIVHTKYNPQVKTTTSRFPLLCDPLAALFGGLGAVSSQFDHTHFLYRRMASQFKRERLQAKKVADQTTPTQSMSIHSANPSDSQSLSSSSAPSSSLSSSSSLLSSFDASSSSAASSSADMSLLLYAYERESRHLAYLRAGTPYITTRARVFDDLCTKWCSDVQRKWEETHIDKVHITEIRDCDLGIVTKTHSSSEIKNPNSGLDVFPNLSVSRSIAAPCQVVLLGGGFDTRAYRLPVLGNAAVFEVDQRDVIRFKEELLPVRYQETPSNSGSGDMSDRDCGASQISDATVAADDSQCRTGCDNTNTVVACPDCLSGCSVSHAILTPNPNNSLIFSQNASDYASLSPTGAQEAEIWPPKVISRSLSRVVGDIGTRTDNSTSKLMARVATDDANYTMVWVRLGENGREIPLTPSGIPYGSPNYFRELMTLHEKYIHDYNVWKTSSAHTSTTTNTASTNTTSPHTKSPTYPFPPPERYEWLAALLRSGWTPQKPSLWLVEGVLMYLTRAQAEEVMSVLAQLAVSHTTCKKIKSVVVDGKDECPGNSSSGLKFSEVELSESWCPSTLSQLVFDCYSSHAAPSGTAYYSLFRYGFERQEAPYTMLSNGWKKMKMAVFGRRGWENTARFLSRDSESSSQSTAESEKPVTSEAVITDIATVTSMQYDLCPPPSAVVRSYPFERYVPSHCSRLQISSGKSELFQENEISPLPRVAHAPSFPLLAQETSPATPVPSENLGKPGKSDFSTSIHLRPCSEARLHGILTEADAMEILRQKQHQTSSILNTSSQSHGLASDSLSSVSSLNPYHTHIPELLSYTIPRLPSCPKQPLPLCFYPDARSFIYAPPTPTRNFPIGWADDTLEAYLAQCARERARRDLRARQDAGQMGETNESSAEDRQIGVQQHNTMTWTLQTLCNQMKVNDIVKLYSTFAAEDKQSGMQYPVPPLYPLHYDRFLLNEAESEGGVLLVHHTKCAHNKKANKKQSYDFEQAARDMFRELGRDDDAFEDYQSICKSVKVECTCDPKITRVECFLIVAE